MIRAQEWVGVPILATEAGNAKTVGERRCCFCGEKLRWRCLEPYVFVVLLDTYGEFFPPSGNPTIIVGYEVTWVVGHTRVMAACCWLEVRGGEEVLVAEHSAGDVVRELFDLFPDVFQKIV